MTTNRKIVVSGAPATGKSTVATALADHLGFPLLSLDTIKETLADVLGTRDEAWSYLLGETAAELVFRLSAAFPFAIVEGWWRGERRARAKQEFVGWTEIFCRCEPSLAEQRMRMRQHVDRHTIHRDMINPAVIRQAPSLAQTVSPLGVGSTVIEIDTTSSVAWDQLISTVSEALAPVTSSSAGRAPSS